MGIFDIVKNAISPITSIIDKAIKDKDLAEKLKNKIQVKLMESFTAEMKASRDVIVAEAEGESWLQRNWRPILMLSFTSIIINNYILSPYLQALFQFSVDLKIPTEMWGLLKLGIGGYILGRSGEKISKQVKKFKK